MTRIGYVLEKVTIAVNCLCGGDGTFEERLYDAYHPALLQLTSNDAPAEIAEELSWVLLLCKNHLVPGDGAMSTVSEQDRRKMAEKLVGLLIATSRMTDRE